MLYGYAIRVPGTWLKDRGDAARDWQALLRLASGSLVDACIALTLFEEQRRIVRADEYDYQEYRRTAESRMPPLISTDADAWFKHSDDVDLAALQLLLNDGHAPRSYADRSLYLLARSFLYALDTIEKALGKLRVLAPAIDEIAKIEGEWLAEFPDLNGVRDSAHHQEDRVRGRAFERKIEPNPGTIPGLGDLGGLIAINFLIENEYGGTMRDGQFGTVKVSPETIEKVGHFVQRAYDAFEWTGPSSILPD